MAPPYRTGATVIAALVCLTSAAARAEFRVSVYGGLGETQDSDVKLTQPGGTELTLKDVPWKGESFKSPLYYGLRATYWFDDAPWGAALDFTHAKMIADPGDVVTVSGTRAGVPVNRNEPVGNTFSNLQLSHGLNLLTLNGLYRLQQWQPVEPYAGLGIGVAIPHVETEINGVQTSKYEFGGVAAQLLLGASVRAYDWLRFFAEYKLSYADVDVDLSGGGTLKTDAWTNHALVGVSFRLF